MEIDDIISILVAILILFLGVYWLLFIGMILRSDDRTIIGLIFISIGVLLLIQLVLKLKET